MTAYERVKAIADKKGITMKELCRRADVNYQSVMRWKVTEPKSFRTLRKLQDAE